ncbi:MAG TPA: hypothetical protein EYG79_10995, partial [Rhodobacteraceae bacterium]|nr:hypothetical protein [Paracoccaceae bacterium]
LINVLEEAIQEHISRLNWEMTKEFTIADHEAAKALNAKSVQEYYAIQSALKKKNTSPSKLQKEEREMNKFLANVDFSKIEFPETNLLSFFHDRLKVYLKDKGIRHDVIDACLAMPGNDDLTLLNKRAEALQAFLNTDDGENLLQGFKRANNILRAEEKKDGVSYEGEPDIKFAEAPAEQALFKALKEASPSIEAALKDENINAAMAALAALRAPIDAFFDDVQVNADNPIVRRNRLCLLNEIRAVMHKVAVFSEING